MSKRAEYILERLWEDSEFVLSREVRQDGSAPALMLAPASEQPAPEIVRRLEYAYSLRHELDSAWAVRPLELVHHDGRPALELEDPGSNLLEVQLRQPMELLQCLRVAVSVVAALGRLHARGLIHRRLEPSSVYVDLAAGKARLICIYLTPRLPRGLPIPAPPELTGATLAYMAPEQTGRINRSTDSRSDLYAYGILLYKMVTGVLPFTAKDPMEWIHCHLAIQPMPPNERVHEIPKPISAIVMKLLAKIPEERYQTAAGVERDLRQCLEALESGGQIAPFTLGVHDVPDQLLISDKLYGRGSEIDTLLTAFKRVASDGTPELVLVSGYSGIGKSTVVNQLHKHLGPLRSLFASGKFDQHKGDIPYTTVTQVFQTLVRQILSKSDGEVSQWRDKIVEALGANGQLISNLLPELELIMGKQPPVPDLPPQDAQNRFKVAFRRFLGVFARPEHPLALFLDDLQWVDSGTLQLLEYLLTEPEVRHVLLIGAYRDHEVGALDPLRRTLEKLRDTGVAVREIALAPLSLRDVTQLVMDSLHAESDRAKPLAQLMHEKTGGNPFFTIQFFKALAEEKLLVFDPATAGWNWNLEHIRTKGFTDNIADLVTKKLDSLPDATQQVLKQLACLGSSAALSTVSMVSGKSEQALDALVLEAIRAGLVSGLNGSLKFVHDRVQEAAYQLIPEADRVFEHLRIGRLLLEHIPPDPIEENIFEIVNQLNRGAAQVTSAEERTRMVELNLIAGKRAKAAAAYASALNYLAISSELLGKDCWDSNYETTFAITLNLAECELLTGQLTSADERLSRLSTLAENHRDRAAVTSLRAVLYTTLNRSHRAVDVCLEYLRHVGLACPQNPTKEAVAEEYERIWLQLGKRTIEELVDLPPMTDPACRGTLEVITAIVPPSWFTDENLRNLLVARMVNLSLEYGNSEASCYAYALLARTLGSHFGDYEAGYRFGTLSLELVDKRGLDRFKTRVYSCFGHHIDPWKRHLKHGRKWLRLAFAAAPQAGDLTFAAYNCANTVANLLASGEPLNDVQNEAESGLEFARRMGNGLAVNLMTSQLTYIRALRGLTTNLVSFNDAEFDEHDFEQHLDRDPQLAAAKFRYWVRKLQAHFFADDYASAAAAAGKAQEFRWRSQSFFEVAEYPFYTALALAGLYSAASINEQFRYLDTIAAYQKLLSIWARNCPENFACMEALVAAEIARIEGRDLDAERLYEDSLSSARQNGFVHNEGLANEFAAKFYSGRDFQTIAYTYLRNARYCYLRWGALGKVRQIEERYPRSTEERTVSLPGAPVAGAAERLDSAAVVKALQAISSEIVLSKLIETLMRIAVEHAGAERGLFLLVRNNESQINAAAATINGRVEVLLQTVAVTTSKLPGSILHYVMRTRESVILEDASVRNLFADDEYLRRRRPKSVLCMPIIRQAEVVGILYLENNLTTHAFTSDRVTVLNFLASQAAISLENARLYADLRQAEALLAGEKRVLEMMSKGDTLPSILEALCGVAEESCDGWIASILLLDANGDRLWHGAAPRLSRDYAQAINGVTVGPDFGPCSMAARLREAVVIADISSDSRWPEYRALALENGLRASWSTPILSLKGEAMGSFGMYCREPRSPSARALDIIKQMTHHAGVAIQRSQAEDALRKSEQKYRDLIDVSPDAIYIIHTDLTYVSANPAGAELAGCTQEELTGTPIAETFVPEERPLIPARMEMMKTEPYLRFERKFVRRNGDIVPVEVSLTTVRGRYLQAVLRDISERKRSEEALRASEQVARGQVEALTYSLDVLATTSEPEKFLGKMLTTICRLLTGQSASLWLFDEPTDSLILRLVVDSVSPLGFDPEHPFIQNPRSWKEDPVIQELFFAAGPIVCEDIETDPRVSDQFREYFMPKGTKKFLAVPILVGGQARGMITVRHSERPPYRTEEIGLTQALAHQVMLAIRLTEVGEQSRQAAVLAERNRMARDVHDTLAQGFTGVIVQLEAANYAISEGDRKDADSHLRRAGELARTSLSEARRSVHALRPQALEQDDFWQALKGIVKSTTVGTTLHTTFETQGKVPVLPPAWQENLLRIGQEALSNTLKYAHARNFRTHLISTSKELRLELRDDGNGFQVKERHDGVGLTGMRERAEEMGAKLKIVSSRGKGTTVTAILPLSPEPML